MLSPELTLELRAARPVASPELRERVLELAAHEGSVRKPFFSRPPLRRLALVAVPAALALAVGGALVHGLTHSGRSAHQPAPVAGATPARAGQRVLPQRGTQEQSTPQAF